jgi:hypothetical protein
VNLRGRVRSAPLGAGPPLQVFGLAATTAAERQGPPPSLCGTFATKFASKRASPNAGAGRWCLRRNVARGAFRLVDVCFWVALSFLVVADEGSAAAARGSSRAASSAPRSVGPPRLPRTSQRAERLVQQGVALYQKGDARGAYRRFLAAFEADAAHPTALFNAALAARKAGLLDEARSALILLLSLHPGDLDVHFGLGEVERTLGHPQAARAAYARVVEDARLPLRDELRERAFAALRILAEAEQRQDQATPAHAGEVVPAFGDIVFIERANAQENDDDDDDDRSRARRAGEVKRRRHPPVAPVSPIATPAVSPPTTQNG